MSTPGPQPIRMRDLTLSIEADDYTASINQAVLTPNPVLAWAGFDNFRAHLIRTDWQVSLGFVQDWAAGSLAIYLVEHAGQYKTITLEVPGRVIAATVLILPAQLGGVANQIPASVATLPVVGEPDFEAEPADERSWSA